MSINKVVRKDENKEEYTFAQREYAFSVLANDIFGLGQYVPSIKITMVQEGLYEAERDLLKEHRFGIEPSKMQIERLLSSPLDKMAVMDVLLGNYDRHVGNCGFSDQDPVIVLIDHETCFTDLQYPHSALPYYWELMEQHHPGYLDKPVDDNLKHFVTEQMFKPVGVWSNTFNKVNMPTNYRKEIVRRIDNMCHAIYKEEALTRRQLWSSPFFILGPT